MSRLVSIFFSGFYYSEAGYACPEGELVRKVDANGNGHKYFPFDCADAKLGPGWTGRPLRDEDKVRECDVFKPSGTDADICVSSKTTGDGNKIVEWSEVEEMAKSATASATEKNKPAPPKSRQECLKMGQQKFAECRGKTNDFEECRKQGEEAIKNCQDGK